MIFASFSFAMHKEHSCIDRYFTLSISAHNSVSILDLVDNLASECRISVVFEDEGVLEQLNRNVGFINAKDFSLNELFELIFSEHNIHYEFDSQREVLKLAHMKTKTFYIDYVNFSQRMSSSHSSINVGGSMNENQGGDRTTISTISDFEFWRSIENEVRNILNQDEFEAQRATRTVLNRDAGTLSVSATKKQLDRVERYITKVMSRLHKQIMIEAKIVEVRKKDEQSRGIDWSQLFGVSGNFSAGYARNISMSDGFGNSPGESGSFLGYDYGLSVNRIMEFLDTYGDVEVVSNPKIMTLNNQPAVINVGEQIFYRYESGVEGGDTTIRSYTTESIFVGISLSVTPEITQDGFVMLTVQPVISNVASTQTQTAERVLPPDIGIKQMSSMVKVKEGGRVVIGGLIESEESSHRVGLPLLKDIPLLGLFFGKDTKREQKKELVIILTPTFLGGENKPSIESFEKLFAQD